MRPFSLGGSAYSPPDRNLKNYAQEVLLGGLLRLRGGILLGTEVEVLASRAQR
jgi:hypothetical protein